MKAFIFFGKIWSKLLAVAEIILYKHAIFKLNVCLQEVLYSFKDDGYVESAKGG